MFLMLLRLALTIFAAFILGKLVSKLRLPAILGWLLAGMLLGPHAFALLDEAMMQENWYTVAVHCLECAVGLLIGTELVWSKIKKTGRQILITTLTQSMGAFLVVTLVFGAVFYFAGIPLYLAVIFGGIALATAPAPAP